MENNNIVLSFKEYKSFYKFEILKDMALLKKVQSITLNSDTNTEVEGIIDRMLDANRPKKDNDIICLLSFTMLLTGFYKHEVGLFDKLYEYIKHQIKVNNKNVNSLNIDVMDLKRELEKML